MEKVAVTGATGFIGKHLVEALSKTGYTVYPIGRDYAPIECDRVYHLACPSTTEFINEHPLEVMDIILDGTRRALKICPSAIFVNASSMGAAEITDTHQGAYNIAKRCMEIYIRHHQTRSVNYRLPAVYGPGMHDDNFIKRCIDGKAYAPPNPDAIYYIAHIDSVIEALIKLHLIKSERITVGEVYRLFSSGLRTLSK